MENFVMLSFLLVVYLYLLIKVWSNLVTKAYSKIFKYIKKGMSEKEETRVTGMRMLVRLHFSDSYIFKAFNIVFIIVVLIVMYDSLTITKSMIATIIYVVAHLIYTTFYMLVEYLSIRNI